MISPSFALLASIVGILIILRLRIHPGLAIFIGAFILSPLVLPLRSIPSLMLSTLIDQQTLRLLIMVASALTLSNLMEEKGLLVRLATTMEGIGAKLAIHIIPAIIGLVPMPAGAVVSATTVRDLVKRLDLSPEQGTFINYWFRHVWEFSMPVYPAIIVASATLSVPLLSVVKTLFPLTALDIVFGVATSYWILKRSPRIEGKPSKSMVYGFVRACWPILLLVILVLSKLETMIAFPLTLVLLAVQQKVSGLELKEALKHGLNYRILLLLYAIMLYRAVIETSGTASVLISDMQVIGLPPVLMLVALPLLIGLTTGISMAFAGVSLPILVPYIALDSGINGSALVLAYASGMIGMLLSPVHLCFILSTEYFKASLGKVYQYTLPLSLAMGAIAVGFYLLAT